MNYLLLACALFLGSNAFALIADAGLHKCGELNNIGSLIGDTKSYGSVKVAYVSTEEPAIAPDHILVFVYDNEMGMTCTAISHDSAGNGFGAVDMSTLKSIGYDAKKGRLLQIQVDIPSDDGGEPQVRTIRFRANALTGKVTLE